MRARNMTFTSSLLLLVPSLLLLAPPPWSASAGDEDVHADTGLILETSVGAPVVGSGEAVLLRVTFRNATTDPMEVFLPQHLGSIVFPRWRLRDAAGRAWRPRQPSFQSMWAMGLQGEILRLEADGTRSFETRVTHFVPDVEGTSPAMDDAALLPAGEYTVTATYEHADEAVPWSDEAFKTRTKPHPGLWTGVATSEPVKLLVRPSREPVLEIDAPELVQAGRPYVLKVTVRNDTDAPRELRCALVVNASSKAFGSGDAHFLVRDTDWRPAAYGAVHALHLPAKGSRSWEIDLLAASFGDARGHSALYRGMVDFLRPGLFRLGARLIDAEGEALASAGLWRQLAGPALIEGGALTLSVERTPRPGTGVHVTVRLRNEGDATVAVPARLAFPRSLYFSLVRPGEEEQARVAVRQSASGARVGSLGDIGSRGVIHEGWSWDGDAFERFHPHDLEHHVVLAPGAELERTLDLGTLVAPDRTLGHGAWILRAYWRNLESGRRLGIDPPLLTGLLVSAPIEIRGRNW